MSVLGPDQPAGRCVPRDRVPATLQDSSGTCMWWYRSSGASPMALSPSVTTFPASLDACEEREEDEWRPVPIRFMGLRTRVGDRAESGPELRNRAGRWGTSAGACREVLPSIRHRCFGRVPQLMLRLT